MFRLNERPSEAEYPRSYEGRDRSFILRQQENTFMANQVQLMRQDGQNGATAITATVRQHFGNEETTKEKLCEERG